MSRKKFVPIIVHTVEGLNAAVADCVKLKLEHAAAVAAMELEITKAREKYQDQLCELADKIEAHFLGIQACCTQHRKSLFTEARKSIDLSTATFGFRENPPSVAKKGKLTWEAVAKLLLSLAWGKDFVRYPEPQVDKQALLKARGDLKPEQLNEAGIWFEQDEEFFLTPKSEVATAEKREVA